MLFLFLQRIHYNKSHILSCHLNLKMKKVHAQLSTIDPPPARRLSHGEKSLANTLGLMETPFQPLNKIKRELKTHGLTHQ